MSSVLSLLPAEGWPRLIIDALWQTTLIAALGSIAAHFLVRQAAARAWLLLLALTVCLMVPLASMAARSAGWTVISLASTRDDAQPIRADDKLLPAPSELPPTEITVPSAQPIVAHHVVAIAPLGTIGLFVMAIVWLSASTFLFVRLALSLLALWRLLRQAKPCTEASLMAAASEASRRVGLARPPRLLVSNAVATPMVLVLGRPTLLLPASQSISAVEINWTAAFTHELAHVVRGDGWSRLWVQLVTIALPLQPLVWVARLAFYTACEEACDDWAVACGSDPVDLATTLLVWINCPPGPLVGIGMSSTKARIRRLMALHTKPIVRLGGGWRWASIPAAILLITGLAVAQAPINGKQQSDATAGFTQRGKVSTRTTAAKVTRQERHAASRKNYHLRHMRR
jgi:beta-lactamase regulating signal transducer with metallopeptidase domain